MTYFTYINPDGKIFYQKPKIIIVGNRQYTPVSDELLIRAGWTIKENEIVESPYVPTYEERVVEKIRERYTVDDELAILRLRDVKPEEFAEYNTYCELCKTQAKLECNE